MCGAGESHSYLVGERHQFRCYETDCRAARRRHDHLHHSCADSSARVFCANERPRSAARAPPLAGRQCGKRLTIRRREIFLVAGSFHKEEAEMKTKTKLTAVLMLATSI